LVRICNVIVQCQRTVDMINSEQFLAFLKLVNETLTATIVVVAVSILLYNLSRGTQDRIRRTSGIVLLCVIVAYLADVFLSLQPGKEYLQIWLRFQWIGIAFIPAALFHLSDALLATTGRPSRGKRKAVIRISYGISTVFTVLALLTDTVVSGLVTSGIPHMRPGPVFPVYVAYLLVVTFFAMVNVVRARRRCLTGYTRRRMTYLLAVFLSPAWGLFPFSLLSSKLSGEPETSLLVVLDLANLIIMLMLIFMAYPLSFFGSEKPDRVIKSQLLEFMLRGPFTGACVLAAILFVPRATNVLGLDGDALMPFAAVATVLFLQWSINLMLPILRRWLIYTDEPERAQWIQRLGDRLLTQEDASQLLESVLAALCDHLRVPTAFVAKMEADGAQLVQVVGELAPSLEVLNAPELSTLANGNGAPGSPSKLTPVGDMFVWHSYWLVPLRYSHPPRNGAQPSLLGILGVWARAAEPDLKADEHELFQALTRQAARVLEGVQHQFEVSVILEGLASQMDMMRQLRGVSRYGQLSTLQEPSDDLISDPDFSILVKDALRDYWGGPKLTESELLKLNVVWREMEEADDRNPVRALRTVLAQAIESLKPQGQRSLTTTEWILYNILEMRFLQGRKVRDVALRLAMSESDLYRKQRIAIEEVARQIEQMERKVIASKQAVQPSQVNGAREA
jgi:hypothetical protein